MITLAFFAITLVIFSSVFGAPDGDRLRFSERREPEVSEYRTFDRRRPNNNNGGGGGSSIQDVFKIPIAVIQGTSAAAQSLLPQNTQAIQSIFDIPVTTLDAVGNYIMESRPQRINNNNNYNNNNNNYNNNNNNNNNDDDANIGSQKTLSLSDQRRKERRDRILKLREEERERRRVMDEERFFHLGHHSSFDFFSSLADLLLGGGSTGGGHHGGNLFGGHNHGHGQGHGQNQWKPPKRPLKPSRPGHHGSHGGSLGNLLSGNGNYQVHEQVDDGPVQSSGIFSWLQTTPNSQFNDNKIQNKIAPGSEFLYDREPPESRSL